VDKWREVSSVCKDYMEKRSGYARANLPYCALHDVPHLENVRRIGRDLYLTLGPAELRKYSFYEVFWDCSAYVHDLGMAIGPRELDEKLQLHTSALRDYLKARAISAGGHLICKMCKYSNFFTEYQEHKNFLEWGRVKTPNEGGINMRNALFAQFIREIHPWISYELAKRELADSLRDVFGNKGKAEEFARYVGLVALLHWRHARLDLPPTEFEGYVLDFRFWGAVIRIADALDATEDRAAPELGYIIDVLKGDISQATHRAFKIVKKVRGVRYWDIGVKIDDKRIVLDVGYGRREAELLGFLLFEVGKNVYEDIYKKEEDYDVPKEVLWKELGIQLPPLWIKAGDKEENLEPYLPHLNTAYEKIKDIKLTKDSPYLEELKKSGAPQELVNLLVQDKNNGRSQQNKCREKCEKKEGGCNPLDALAVAVLTQTPADGVVRLILRDLNSREVEKLLRTLAR